jgi:hypothetical protein
VRVEFKQNLLGGFLGKTRHVRCNQAGASSGWFLSDRSIAHFAAIVNWRIGQKATDKHTLFTEALKFEALVRRQKCLFHRAIRFFQGSVQLLLSLGFFLFLLWFLKKLNFRNMR